MDVEGHMPTVVEDNGEVARWLTFEDLLGTPTLTSIAASSAA